MANRKDFIYSGPSKPDVPKSHHDLSYTNNFTASFGKIYPLGCWLLPSGSSFKCTTDFGFDLQPLVFPVQTNMRFHVKFYAAPLRILWKNLRNFVSMGGKGYQLPYISRDFNFYKTGSLADYMGVPSFQVAYTQENYTSVNMGIGICSSFDKGSQFGFNNSFPVVVSANDTDVVYVSLMPVGRGFFRHLNSDISFKLRVSNTPTLNSSTYIVIAKRNDRSETDHPDVSLYSILWSAKLDNTNTSITQVTSKKLYNLVFSKTALPPVATLPDTDLVIGITGNLASHFYADGDSLSLTVPAYDGTIQSSNGVPSVLKMPSYTISAALSEHYHVLSLNASLSYATDESNATHFMSVNGEPPKLPLLAFRFRMYEFIYNYFIRNERVTPFMLPDSNGVYQQVFNRYLTNDDDGADSTTPLDFKYAPYEYDLFTTCVKQPTFGDAPLVGVSFTVNDTGQTPVGTFSFLRDGSVEPETIGVNIDGQGNITGISNYSVDSNHPNIHNLQELINFGISINDLRNVSAYQRYKERLMKAGTKYENIIYEFFGTNPPTGEEFPRYIGGYTQLIRTDKVLSQASTEKMSLGEYRGNAYVRSDKKNMKRKIRTYCHEDTYIMAVGWFSVTPTYSQKIDKDFLYNSLLDFYNPQFASVSPQPVYDYQIAPLECELSDEKLHHVFGYNRPFAEYVSKQDEVHGEFRSGMQNYVCQRIFGGVPQLNEDFLLIKPEQLSDIFAVNETTDKIFGQIHFDVDAVMPIPHFSVPKIV